MAQIAVLLLIGTVATWTFLRLIGVELERRAREAELERAAAAVRPAEVAQTAPAKPILPTASTVKH